MNHPIVQWIKSNVLIVIFGIIVVAAFVALPLISNGMNAEVEEKLEGRLRLANDLTRLNQTQVDLKNPSPLAEPMAPQTALINPAALREFSDLAAARKTEADEVFQVAERHNQRGREVLVSSVFPKPAAGREFTVTEEMSHALNAAYRDLLNRLNAGEAPSLESMQDTLVRHQKQYITNQLNKPSRTDLTDEELQRLREELGARRFGIVREQAQTIRTYATIEAINPPSWKYGQTPMPTPEDLFEWQWDYWAIEDILLALDQANAGAAHVLEAPVKRIISIDRLDAPDQKRDSGGATPGGGGIGGGSGPFLSGGGSGMGSGGGDTDRPNAGGGQQPTPQQPQPADPTKEVVRDFSQSFTGRVTNPLFDVRLYRVHMIVESARLRSVIDNLGRQNFMTVVGLEMLPADPYESLQAGYYYGAESTVDVILDVETIWLRSWTTPFMPDGTKAALKISTPAKPAQPGGA